MYSFNPSIIKGYTLVINTIVSTCVELIELIVAENHIIPVPGNMMTFYV